jgi:hypothetical protein
MGAAAVGSDNVLDVVEELREIVGEFKRILYGDAAARTNGLVVEFGDLRREVASIKEDLHRMKSRRPVIGLWVGGYVAFVAAVAFGVVAGLNLVGARELWSLPAPVAVFLATFCALVALFLFMAGFGWIDGRE